MSGRRLVCLGFGYSARAAAHRLVPQRWNIVGTQRKMGPVRSFAWDDAVGHPNPRTMELSPFSIPFDGTERSAALADAIQAATHLLVSVPPGKGGDPTIAHHGGDVAGARGLAAVVYLSTVGVYGDAGGAWVDETTPERPTSARSRVRLAAERDWRKLATSCGCRLVILRLAGIYGPGRSAIDNLRDGTARRIVKPGQVFNRIHVEDVALAIEAALQQPTAAGVYNVTDDAPAPPQDVIAHAAALLGVPLPPEIPFEQAELSPMAASFYAESKRVRNDRLKGDLGVRLAYPTYREGLAQILSQS